MSIDELSKQLASLQDELRKARNTEADIQQKITDTLQQLDVLLSSTPANTDDIDGALTPDVGDLPQMLRRFEAEYPELTSGINRVLVTLGNMGI